MRTAIPRCQTKLFYQLINRLKFGFKAKMYANSVITLE